MSIRGLLILAVLASGCITGSETGSPPHVIAYLLWADPYPELIIEIDHVEGWEPSTLAIESLVQMLREETDKENISVVLQGGLPRRTANSHLVYTWTLQELEQFAADHLDSAKPGTIVTGDAAVIHVLYVDGRFESAAGVAIGRTAFLFEPNGFGMSWQLPTAARDHYQRALLIHEVGHVIGLVDNGVPMVRDHAMSGDPYHSANPESVMHPSIDDMPLLMSLAGQGDGPPYRFDADDKADLAAFREQGRAWAARQSR